MWAGVDLFFTLSGFLITGILIHAKHLDIWAYFKHFYGRRVRRILPPSLLFLAATSIFFGVAWLRHWYMYAFLMNLLLVSSAQRPEPFRVLWSLAVEEQFYLLWPFVVFFLRERAIAATAILLMVAAPILRWTMTPLFHNYAAIYMLTPFRMDMLAAGALLAVVWRHKRSLVERFGAFGPIASICAVAGLGFLGKFGVTTTSNTRFSNTVIYELTLIASVGLVLWALSGRYVGILRWPPIVYFGRISYSFYLIHTLPIIVLRSYLHNVGQIAVASLVLTVLYSAASWHFFEKPLLYGKRGTRVRVEAEDDEKGVTEPLSVKAPTASA